MKAKVLIKRDLVIVRLTMIYIRILLPLSFAEASNVLPIIDYFIVI